MRIDARLPSLLDSQGRGSLAAHEGGAAILEFAIVLPLLLALLGGTFEIGRALLVRQAMIAAVSGGARSLARIPDPSCSPTCTPRAAHVIELTIAAIVENARVPRASVQIDPHWDPSADTVTIEAKVAFEGPLLRLVGLAPLLTLEAGHAERHIAE